MAKIIKSLIGHCGINTYSEDILKPFSDNLTIPSINEKSIY